ncbi:MAG TPA: hypothetical protein VFX49_05695, partial [Chloroflexota bacterium]|nr:hypothetical protein [Chloroflexota bacterium]
LYAQDLQDPEKSALYFRNLIEVRRAALASDLPWWQVVCSNQIRPHTVVPTAANLALQAYTTLAAGGTGVGWFTYYGLAYGHAPIDGATGRKTPAWYALRAVNEQVRTIGAIVARLRSTGVFVAAPDAEPWRAAEIDPLPGRVIEAIDAPDAVMAGEFSDSDGGDYALLVNLSLERSQKVVPHLAGGRQATAASPDDGAFRPLDATKGIWLPPGQGILLRLE